MASTRLPLASPVALSGRAAGAWSAAARPALTGGALSAAFLLYLLAARYLAAAGVASDRGMAAAVQAWLAVRGATPGPQHFVHLGAPLAAILDIPSVVSPGAAGWIGAVIGGASAAWLLAGLCSGLATLGLTDWRRWLLLIPIAGQPLLIVCAAGLAPAVTGAALALWSVVFGMRSWTRGSSLDLAQAGFTLGFACLSSYRGLLIGGAMVVLMWLHDPAQRARAGALAVAYASAAAGVLLPWAGVMALYSSAGAHPPAAARPFSLPPLSQDAQHPGWIALYALAVSLGPWLLYACWRALRGAEWHVALPAVSGTMLLFPALLSLVRTGHASAEDLLTGWGLGLLALGAWTAGRRDGGLLPPTRRDGSLPRAVIAAAFLIASAAVELGAWRLGLGSNLEQQAVHVLMGNAPGGQPAVQWAIGRYLAGKLDERRILIDDRLGYPAMYWSGRQDGFYTPADIGFDSLVHQPQRFLSYVLVASPSPELGPDVVDQAFGGLYQSGAPWAELEREWPPDSHGAGGWRLYRVRQAA